MRIVVTGTQGQVARALAERTSDCDIDLVALGRPELDFTRPETIASALRAASPDIIINAAAYTAVDRAETEPQLADAINGHAAGAVARAANDIGAPVIHLSTDYVFDGTKTGAYVETDAVNPIGAYGRSKLLGEQLVAKANARHLILRTSWVYSPFGANFVKTMLKLGETRDAINVVADQYGSPTSALDLADAVLALAQRLRTDRGDAPYGILHVAGSGTTNWAQFAEAIFASAAAHGRPVVTVRPITTADYPTAARRPQNSVLNCARLADRTGIVLPDWRHSVQMCVKRLLQV